MIPIVIFSILTIISSIFSGHGTLMTSGDDLNPKEKCYGLHPRDELNCMMNPTGYQQVSNIQCEKGTHAEELDLSWNPVLDKENLETDCIPDSTNAQFWHDWYNYGCLWMSKHTEWADHISKVKQINGTLFVCDKFNGFMTGDNKYGYQQVGETGDQYVKSECVDLATDVDGQCYMMINNNPNSIMNMFKNSNVTVTMNTTTFEQQNYTGVKQ